MGVAASWESLPCPLGADRSHSRPPTRAFVVSFVCVMDWPGYFAAQTSPRGRETEPRVPAPPANGKPRCLHVLVGNMGRGLRCGDVCPTKPSYISEFALMLRLVVEFHLFLPSMNVFISFYICFF